MMGDADHFSRSTDRDIFSEEDGVKCRESEKDPEVITTSNKSLSSQQMSLRSKKTPRGKSSRKNNQRQALLSAENRFGYVNAAEHEEQFCSCVNLYVDYLLARAVEELVVDAPEINKVQNGGGLSKDGEETGIDGVESEPVFTATDDSYMDLISEEIHSTLPRDERQTGYDQEECRVKKVDLKDAVGKRDEEVSKYVTNRDLSPPLLSETDGKKDFEIAAVDYMNTSFPEDEVEEDEYDSAGDVFENVSSSIQCDVDEEVSETSEQRFKQQNQRRCRYEFEVDCETGMVFSFEIVEPVAEKDESAEEYEYEDCDDCDGRDSAEDIDDESNVCLVEFEPDDESGVFRIIDENDDVEETVYMVVDEDGRDNKLARKTSDFRSRSPTKLPRAMREGTDSHRRRCYSTGDTERIESLESSSSEFYSYADTLDRFLTLPSPPKSSPGSCEVDDSEEELSSSQEELERILDPLILKNQNNAKHIKDVIGETANVFDGDLTVPCENETKSLVNNNQDLRSSDGQNTEPQDEDERLWQDLTDRHQKKLNELDLDHIQHCEVSYNANHRTAEEQPASNTPPETCPVSILKHGCLALDEMDSLAIQETSHLNAEGDEEMNMGDQDKMISTRHRLTQRGDLPLDIGCPVEPLGDADGYHFEKIRNRHGRLNFREFNELLTELAREQEAMDRMLRDAHRAQEEFIQLRNGVKKLLERLESCQPA